MFGIIEVNCYEKFDWFIFNEMGELGMFGVILFEEYGGLGLNYVCYGLIVWEVEWVDFVYCFVLSV